MDKDKLDELKTALADHLTIHAEEYCTYSSSGIDIYILFDDDTICSTRIQTESGYGHSEDD